MNASRRDHVEKLTLRIVGSCFLALAVYVGYESLESIIRHMAPEQSIIGIASTALLGKRGMLDFVSEKGLGTIQ